VILATLAQADSTDSAQTGTGPRCRQAETP
jgi:hypothetical protein